MRPLTDRQCEILTYIVTHWGQTQTMPTMRQIMSAFRIRSPNGVVCHLKALAKKGWIEVEEIAHRGIRVPMLADAARRSAADVLRKLPRVVGERRQSSRSTTGVP